MPDIRQRRVLHDVLLQTLAEYRSGVSIHDVYDLIDRQYTFPEDWYRQIPSAQGYDFLKDLGITDWRTVPQETLVRLVPTEPQWQNEIRWSRNELRKEDFLDTSAPRGTWRLTEAGFAAAETLDDGDLTPRERQILTTRRPLKTIDGNGGKQAPNSVRTELLRKLQMYTQAMPLDDLETLLEIAWAIRKRSLPEDISAA